MDRNLLIELVETVHVGENNEVTVALKFNDQHQHVAEFIENNQSVMTKHSLYSEKCSFLN